MPATQVDNASQLGALTLVVLVVPFLIKVSCQVKALLPNEMLQSYTQGATAQDPHSGAKKWLSLDSAPC